ncbi:hypothetical protein [Leptospira harrisiae]|nr:hypothetical protein [Leptospira harrisiae]
MKNKIVLFTAVVAIFLVNFYYRSFTFNYSTIDWDELTYFIMGNSILNGSLPYRDFWDLKPLGIYLIHTFTLLFFDYSILTMRLSAYFFSSILGVILFISNYRKRFWESLLISFVFLYSLIYYSSGLASNTEIYFLFFESISFYMLFVARETGVKRKRIAFFVLGTAFIVKYIVVFDVIFFFLVSFVFSLRDEKTKKISSKHEILNKIFFEYFLHAFTFLAPFMITAAVYFYLGSFDLYWNSILAVGKSHVRLSTMFEKIQFILTLKYFYLASLVFVGYHFSSIKKPVLDRKSCVALGWFLTSSLGAVWTGFLYQHYLLAVVFPILLFISFVVFDFEKVFGKGKITRLVLLLCIIGFSIFSIRKRNHIAKTLNSIPDQGLFMADAIRQISLNQFSGDAHFFVAAGSHAPYVILNQLPPVKYIQPNNYLEKTFAVNLSISGKAVISDIIKQNVNIVTWCNAKTIDEILRLAGDDSDYSIEFVTALQTFLRDYSFKSVKIEKDTTCTLYYKGV